MWVSENPRFWRKRIKDWGFSRDLTHSKRVEIERAWVLENFKLLISQLVMGKLVSGVALVEEEKGW